MKARKLAQLEAEYGKIVKMKQAEPAICALHRIGLGYSRFAQALYDNPIPREVKALGKEGLDEYKAQLAQVADPLEKKAIEGYQLAVNASRDYGVTNSCSREALQALQKAKPEAVEGSSRRCRSWPRCAGRPPVGYGLLRELQAQAAPRPAARPGDAGAARPSRTAPRKAAGHLRRPTTRRSASPTPTSRSRRGAKARATTRTCCRDRDLPSAPAHPGGRGAGLRRRLVRPARPATSAPVAGGDPGHPEARPDRGLDARRARSLGRGSGPRRGSGRGWMRSRPAPSASSPRPCRPRRSCARRSFPSTGRCWSGAGAPCSRPPTCRRPTTTWASRSRPRAGSTRPGPSTSGPVR